MPGIAILNGSLGNTKNASPNHEKAIKNNLISIFQDALEIWCDRSIREGDGWRLDAESSITCARY